ncbi:MAG: hypothetical protein GWN79_11945, partial [Actinobacteria bacterium]|nr:hypothetical protein [Actinomycetota bacterium]NIS32128.1 hypothetical protein [Actinomycetota bacterium]NIT96066.1 hypothetical protein [Actinomycetota bacterium]NIU19755.1 hypothetical protein [Actinomycetota bacterium]NIU67194.1 hypothetical protein [Actinomycetota bacterium]
MVEGARIARTTPRSGDPGGPRFGVTMTTRTLRWLALLLAFTFFAAACGGEVDDDTGDDGDDGDSADVGDDTADDGDDTDDD